MSEVLLTRAELIAERELSAAAIARLTAERNDYAKQCADLRNKIEWYEREFALATVIFIKEVTRLRDELDMVNK